MVVTVSDTRSLGSTSVAAQSDNVGAPSASWSEMFDSEVGQLVEALMGGTESMREGTTQWLPKESQETDATYSNRLCRSFLFPAFSDTIDKTLARPFSRPVSLLGGDIPPVLADIEYNVDLRGRNLTTFAREVFRDALTWGIAHVFTDAPEGVRAGARPYMTRIDPRDVLGCQYRVDEFGNYSVVQLRIREVRTEPVGRFGQEPVPYVKVYGVDEETGALYWETWRAKASPLISSAADLSKVYATGDFELVGERMPFGLDYIPLRTLYFNRTGFMTARPPFEGLAYLNLEHWQSSSDQRHILRFIRTGVWFGSGLTQEEANRFVAVGPNQFVWSEQPQSDLKAVDSAGSGAELGQEDIRRIEERMEVLGLKPFLRRSSSGQTTATERRMNSRDGETEAQSWIRVTEELLTGAYEDAAAWKRVSLPDDFIVNIYSEFLEPGSVDDIDRLFEMRTAGELTRRTFLAEIQRRGVLAEGLDLDEEATALDAEETERSRIAHQIAGVQDAAQEDGVESDDEDDPEDEDGQDAQTMAGGQ